MTPEYTPEQQAIIDRYSYEIVAQKHNPRGEDTAFRKRRLRDAALNFALLINEVYELSQAEKDSELQSLWFIERKVVAAVECENLLEYYEND